MTEKVNTLRIASVEKLKMSIGDNLAFYEGDDDGRLACFFAGEDPCRETGINIPGLPDGLQMPSNGDFRDKENSAAIYRALKTLQPRQAAVEVVWAHLTHYAYPGYVRARWPVPSGADKNGKIDHIAQHWFVSGGNRGLIRNNAVSRLWWMGFVSSRCEGISLEDTLAAALYRQDVRKNLFERSFCASAPIFTAMMKCLRSSYTGRRQLFEREHFRKLSKALNRVGGRRLLDSLSPQALDSLLADLIHEELGLRMSDL